MAVVDGKGQAPIMTQNPKGPSKGGKSKNKSKGKGTSSKGFSKGPTGKNRAKAALICLRCGKQGHFAANCPSAGKSSSPAKKRPIDLEDPMINMIMSVEPDPNSLDDG